MPAGDQLRSCQAGALLQGMQLEQIQVECYAGHKADETPRRFYVGGLWVEVLEVVDRWYQGAGNPEWPVAAYFKVLGKDLHEYLLKHDQEADTWYLAQKW